MKAIERETHNLVYKGEHEQDGRTVNEGVFDLSCERRDGAIFSHWRPNSIELVTLNAGGCIELGVHTEPIPPVSVNVVGPEVEVPLPSDTQVRLADAVEVLARELYRVEWWRLDAESGDFDAAPPETRADFERRAAAAFGLTRTTPDDPRG